MILLSGSGFLHCELTNSSLKCKDVFTHDEYLKVIFIICSVLMTLLSLCALVKTNSAPIDTLDGSLIRGQGYGV